MPDIEARNQGCNRSILKLQCTSDMGWGMHVDDLASMWLTGNLAFGERNTSGTGNALDGSHQGDQSRQVIGSHIKERPGSRLIEEMWIRMPAFGAMPQKESSGRDRRANCPIIDQIDAGLDATAQKGIRCIADPQLAFLSQAQKGQSLLAVKGQGFFSVDRFPGLERGETDLSVSLRNRQIEHHLDLGIGQQFFSTQHPGNAEGRRLALRTCSYLI